jgi:hypothetical protein
MGISYLKVKFVFELHSKFLEKITGAAFEFLKLIFGGKSFYAKASDDFLDFCKFILIL